MKFLSYLKNISLLLTVPWAVGLVLSAVAQYFDPVQHWVFALIGLAFLPLVIANIFFLVFWIIVRIRFAWIPLLGLVVAIPALLHVVSFNVFNAKRASDAHDLKVMTYNVRNFDLYNWNGEAETRRKMMSLIGDEQPNVACFQEFYTQDKGAYDNTSTLTKSIGFRYNHVEITNTVDNGQHWGIATFSNFPIVGRGKVEFPMRTNNACIYTDLDVHGDTVRVYNVHLQSIYLTKKDYAYIEDFKSDRNKLNTDANERILTKLKKAYQRRANQVNLIEKHIASSPYPVLLCGDFNDTPASYAYRTFTRGLDDCFLERGWGISPTYSGAIPFLRIDYVLHDSTFVTQAYKTIRQAYSDHYPVVTELSFTHQGDSAKP